MKLIPPTTEQLVEQLEKAKFKITGDTYAVYGMGTDLEVEVNWFSLENPFIRVKRKKDQTYLLTKDLAGAVKLALCLREVVK